MPTPPSFSIDGANEIIDAISPKTGSIIDGHHSQTAINLKARAQLQTAVALVEHIDEELRKAIAAATRMGTVVSNGTPLSLVHTTLQHLAKCIEAGRVLDATETHR